YTIYVTSMTGGLLASALRTPISIMGSYTSPFATMGHHEMNSSLTSPGAYASLHNIPPQMSAAAAAAAAYIQPPMVSFGAVRSTFTPNLALTSPFQKPYTFPKPGSGFHNFYRIQKQPDITCKLILL
uniref:Uncharacterized protein n=1 Tax=Cairina moschata TaxID=8855 RepID=A0A8C3BVC9_CAIMO